jgi:hypothetical protein
MVMRATSLSDVSLIAIVPDNECRIPTLIGPDAESSAGFAAAGEASVVAGASVAAVLSGGFAASLLQPRETTGSRVARATSHVSIAFLLIVFDVS